jgi:ribosomal-protein-alanine N-acetyltransferase
MRNFEILKLNQSHYSQMSDFFNELRQENNEYFSPHPFTDEYISQLTSEKVADLFYIIILDGVVTGYGMLRGWDEGYSEPSLGIFISSKYRGIGLGRHLLNHLHLNAQLIGCSSIRLKFNSKNTTASELYKSMGYVFCGFDEHGYVMARLLLND